MRFEKAQPTRRSEPVTSVCLDCGHDRASHFWDPNTYLRYLVCPAVWQTIAPLPAAAAGPPTSMTSKPSSVALPRTDAILAALSERGGSATSTDILTVLQAHGRADDTRDLITATANHLKRNGHITTSSRGHYALGP